MDWSSGFTFTTRHCAPAPSPGGSYVAYISGSNLVIRNAFSLTTKRVLPLKAEFARSVWFLEWDDTVSVNSELRLAVGSSAEVQIYVIDGDRDGTRSDGIIRHGSDDIASITWMSTTYRSGEGSNQAVRIATVAKHGMALTLWSADGIERVVPNPKWARVGSMQKKDSTKLTVITRDSTADWVQTVPIVDAKAKPTGFALEGILDAKDAKFSETGALLAVVDTPAIGYRVAIYGAEGSLLYMYYGHNSDVIEGGLKGATTIEWAPASVSTRSEILLIGDQNEEVTVLSSENFSVPAIIQHGTIHDDAAVWVESDSGYRLASSPYIPPTALGGPSTGSAADPERGIRLLKASNNLFATVVESMSSTVWVWSIGDSLIAPSLISVIVHSAPISCIQWHSDGSLITVAKGTSRIGYWSGADSPPQMFAVSGTESGTISDATWVGEDHRILAWDRTSYSIGLVREPKGKGGQREEIETVEVEEEVDEEADADAGIVDPEQTITESPTTESVPEPVPEYKSKSKYLHEPQNEHEHEPEPNPEPQVVPPALTTDSFARSLVVDPQTQSPPERSRLEFESPDRSPAREGSPQLLQDDDTRVRDMVNAIQQNEWAEDLDKLRLDDTFHDLAGRKRQYLQQLRRT